MTPPRPPRPARPASPALVALATLAAALPAPAAAQSPLENAVEARLEALDATATVFAEHVPTGRTVAVDADRPMNTLSVIKLPIMVLAFRDAEAGRLDLEERATMTAHDLRRGSGLLQTFQPGLEPTWRDLVTQMIITSDNTATDMMIGRLGMTRVNALLDSLGYRQTRLKHTTGELFRFTWTDTDPALASLTDREVFERGFPGDPGAAARSFALEGDSARWLGRSTARETARLLRQILDGDLASPEHSREMVGILRRQFYDSRLPCCLPPGVSVAHKTGDWPPYAGNDVGILFYEGGPTVVAAFTNQNTGDFAALERTLGEVAALLVSAWR